MNAKRMVTSVLALGVLGATSMGCGQNVTGTYNMTQGLAGGITTSTCANAQATWTLQQNGSSVTGNAQSACYEENLIGTESNSQIMVSSMTLTPINTSMAGQSTCTYSGTLSVSGSEVSGTLTELNQVQTNGYQLCPSAVSISGSHN